MALNRRNEFFNMCDKQFRKYRRINIPCRDTVYLMGNMTGYFTGFTANALCRIAYNHWT
jgi:hypothetical protein